MEDEGIFAGQGARHQFSRLRLNFSLALVAAFLMISVCANARGQSAACEDISEKIAQHARELEYDDEITQRLIGMVSRWENKKGIAFLAAHREKLGQVREDYRQGSVEIAGVVKAERKTAEEIAWMLESKLGCSDNNFELADVIKNKQASCLGFTQLFYILGNSVELSFIPITVVEAQSPGPLPAGAAHVSCIAGLSDGRVIMVSSVPGGFSVSEPFVMEEQFTEVDNYWRLSDKDNPLQICREIGLLDKDGLVAYIYSNRGTVEASAGRFSEAIANFTRAIELNPDFADAYNNRGIVYRNLGQLRQAICDYTKATELKPDYTEAYNNRGVAYVKLGEPNKGICDYDKCIELNPRFAEAYNNRANAYARLERFEHAICDYTTAIENNPHLAEAYGNRAVMYALSGKPERAKKDLLKAGTLDSSLKTRVKQISDDFNLNLKLN